MNFKMIINSLYHSGINALKQNENNIIYNNQQIFDHVHSQPFMNLRLSLMIN